jgi:hypothetical protein
MLTAFQSTAFRLNTLFVKLVCPGSPLGYASNASCFKEIAAVRLHFGGI